MKIVAIVQARMGSTRLPGKVMKEILGRPMLYHFIERLKRAKRIDEIVIATVDEDESEPIVTLAGEMGVEVFRGSETDVLDRFYQCAKEYDADIIVRVTSDCPLVDPEVVDGTIETYLSGDYDYVSNNLERSFPHGLDTEVFSFEVLERAWLESSIKDDREHVTLYIRNNLDEFHLGNYRYHEDISNLRWTVDYPEDFDFVKKVFEAFGGNDFIMRDILELLEDRTELISINKKWRSYQKKS